MSRITVVRRSPKPERGGSNPSASVASPVPPCWWRRCSSRAALQVLRVMAARKALNLQDDDRNVEDLLPGVHSVIGANASSRLSLALGSMAQRRTLDPLFGGSIPSAPRRRRHSGNRSSCLQKKDERNPRHGCSGALWRDGRVWPNAAAC